MLQLCVRYKITFCGNENTFIHNFQNVCFPATIVIVCSTVIFSLFKNVTSLNSSNELHFSTSYVASVFLHNIFENLYCIQIGFRHKNDRDINPNTMKNISVLNGLKAQWIVRFHFSKC